MSGLLLNLKPYEKVLIDGTVIQNGGRRSQIRVMDNHVGVLRLQDALHPEQAVTPLSRAYLAAQNLMMQRVSGPKDHVLAEQLLRDVINACSAGPIRDAAVLALAEVQNGQYYRALKAMRPALPIEAALLLAPQSVEVC